MPCWTVTTISTKVDVSGWDPVRVAKAIELAGLSNVMRHVNGTLVITSSSAEQNQQYLTALNKQYRLLVTKEALKKYGWKIKSETTTKLGQVLKLGR